MTENTTLPVVAVLGAVPVRDAEVARAFHEQLIGAPPDESPMPGLSQWELGTGVLQVGRRRPRRRRTGDPDVR